MFTTSQIFLKVKLIEAFLVLVVDQDADGTNILWYRYRSKPVLPIINYFAGTGTGGTGTRTTFGIGTDPHPDVDGTQGSAYIIYCISSLYEQAFWDITLNYSMSAVV